MEEEKEDRRDPFLRILFVSIHSQISIKTFDVEFKMSLDDFIIFHEQFITKDNEHLRLVASQHERNENTTNIDSNKLIHINVLHTSSDNPLFTSSKYGELENKVDVRFNRLILTIQLEALLSIMKFQNNIKEKWPKGSRSKEQTPKTKSRLNIGELINRNGKYY